MKLSSLLPVFAEAEASLHEEDWHDGDWSYCSGLWKDERYPPTMVLKASRRDWSSRFPITLYDGAEMHYAAWVDEKTLLKSEVVFGMHVFSFPTIDSRRVKKGDFTDPFRERCGEAIASWGFHDMKRGPRVPYGGRYRFEDTEELAAFLVEDFGRFASLQPVIDEVLEEMRERH